MKTVKDYGFRKVGVQKYAKFGSYGTYFLEDGPFCWSAWLEDLDGKKIANIDCGADTGEEAYSKVVNMALAYFENAYYKTRKLHDEIDFDKDKYIAELQYGNEINQ